MNSSEEDYSYTIRVKSIPNVNAYNIYALSGEFNIVDTSSDRLLLNKYFDAPRGYISLKLHNLTISYSEFIGSILPRMMENSEFSLIDITHEYIIPPPHKSVTLGPFKRVPKDSNFDDCPICLKEFKFRQAYHKLPCDCVNVYHKNCIERWIKSSDNCPTCRAQLSSLAPAIDSLAREREPIDSLLRLSI